MNILPWSLMFLSLAIVTYAAALGWAKRKPPKEARHYVIIFTTIFLTMPIFVGAFIVSACPGPGEWLSAECLNNQTLQNEEPSTLNNDEESWGGFDE
ncbi:MAG: hypothetical protein WAO98_05545 [Alphaproteobacteria bacterium]